MSHDSSSSLTELRNNMYYGSEVINRVSFLREDDEFIAASAVHPSTRFIFFYRTNPLVIKNSANLLVVLSNGDNQLPPVKACADGKETSSMDSYKVVRRGLNRHPQWNEVIQTWINDNREKSSAIRDKPKPGFLFMGLLDESVGLNLSSLKFEEDPENSTTDEKYLDYQGRYQGIPYYAVDMTNAPALSQLVIDHILSGLTTTNPESEHEVFYTYSRKHFLSFPHSEAALYSHGRMFFDWLNKNKFCAGCGNKVIPINAGGKLHCTNMEKIQGKDRFVCPLKSTSPSNLSFPRTDAVIITAITDTNRTKVLLSLGKRHAAVRMWTCTAGFMEPSETVEVATKREIWEETGVVCKDISIVMTQPWPFPCNIMIGCIATVQFNGMNEIIDLGHDGEIAEAKWFDVETLRKLMDGEDIGEDIMLPLPESIAFSLIKQCVAECETTTVQGGKL